MNQRLALTPIHTTLLASAMTLAVLVAGLGLADELWSHTLNVEGAVGTGELDVEFTAAFTNDDGVVDDPSLDPDDDDGGLDPGYSRGVAACHAQVGIERDSVSMTVSNAYPSYTCQFWVTVTNVGLRTLRRTGPEIQAPSVLTVIELGETTSCSNLRAGETEVETFTVHLEQPAQQQAPYTFLIEKTFAEAVQGTPGFWKNWDKHETFTQEQIESWLAEIDSASDWLGPTTVEGMEAVFDATKGKSSSLEKFLAQYLALRLNSLAGLLCPGETHNVSAFDPDNYLGLADPTKATLSEIIAAVESKFGTGPTDKQFEIMKDVLDALNNLEI